jgi:hypothetical protein
MKSYIAFLSIESPTTSVILSVRDKRNSFYDQLGTIGVSFGLFTGMSLLSMVEVMFLMGNIFKQAKAKYYARKYGKRLEFFLPKTAQEVEEIARKKKVKKMESDLVSLRTMNDDLLGLVKAMVVDDPEYRDSLFKQIEKAEQDMDLMMEPPVEEVEESVLEPEDLETYAKVEDKCNSLLLGGVLVLITVLAIMTLFIGIAVDTQINFALDPKTVSNYTYGKQINH